MAGRPRKYNYEIIEKEIMQAVDTEAPEAPLTDQQLTEKIIRKGISCTAPVIYSIRKTRYPNAKSRKVIIPANEGN